MPLLMVLQAYGASNSPSISMQRGAHQNVAVIKGNNPPRQVFQDQGLVRTPQTEKIRKLGRRSERNVAMPRGKLTALTKGSPLWPSAFPFSLSHERLLQLPSSSLLSPLTPLSATTSQVVAAAVLSTITKGTSPLLSLDLSYLPTLVLILQSPESTEAIVDGNRRECMYVCMYVFFSLFWLHHKKNQVVKFDHVRSGPTVSEYCNAELTSLLKLHPIILVRPKPVDDECPSARRQRFKFFVNTGQYYLHDNGYMNHLRFVAPYRSIRYHWDDKAECYRAPK
ncbi:hypothetical protein BUALT_Bualt17G0030800 [Buddleja alternifolia]|uniref:Uncharacterized protein n=1 Tax=Buddleja alternifolia TaxID=168488 RepID=A0AAV6WF24_9LAMI|nr:hypothetical protein BUALT_Bualt17G0030800 [Buddleja alternifolia]